MSILRLEQITADYKNVYPVRIEKKSSQHTNNILIDEIF